MNFIPWEKEWLFESKFCLFVGETEILKNCNKFKGKNIRIVHKQTPKPRYESSILRKHLNLAKHDQQNNCYIKRNKLYVNENIYSVENLLGVEELANNLNKKPNSAPSTPTAVDPILPENRNVSFGTSQDPNIAIIVKNPPSTPTINKIGSGIHVNKPQTRNQGQRSRINSQK